jgi:hypothetical protein
MTAKMRGLPPAPRIKVIVTKEIIATAMPADSGHCMIADALVLSYPAAAFPSADLATIRCSDIEKGLRYIYLTPRSAQEALIRFDQGERPEPFAFELRSGQTTQPSKRLTVRRSDGSKMRPRKRKSRNKSSRLVGTNDGAIPQIRGGSPPPMGALAGGSIGAVRASRRRSFGLRSMDRLVSTEAARAVLAEHGGTAAK